MEVFENIHKKNILMKSWDAIILVYFQELEIQTKKIQTRSSCRSNFRDHLGVPVPGVA